MKSNGNIADSAASPALSEEKRRLFEQRLQRLGRPAASAPQSIPSRPETARRLASLGQARIWVLDDLNENSPSYNITSSFIVENAVDSAALEFALNQVVARHETLRSCYRLVDGEVEECIHNELALSLDRHSCDSLEHARQSAQAFGRIPFSVQSGPLLRLGLFSASGNCHVLILSIHDIVFDKWSLKLFWSEFSQFYRLAVTGVPATVPELPIAYSDFAHWQREWLKSGEQTRQIAYWKKRLENPPPPISLPTDRPYPSAIADPGSLARSRISDSVSQAVRHFSAENEVSLFTTFLMGFGILLARYSETDDVLISSPVANRRKKETANLIGFFLNTLVARIDLSGNPTVTEALARAKSTVAGALEHQDLPTDAIVDALKPGRVPGRHPLFQTMFVFQREDEGAPKLNLQGCVIRPTFIETKTSKFDLSLFVAESGRGFETVAEFRTDIFREETIRRFLDHFNALMADLAAHPEKRVYELNLLSASELESLLRDFQGEPIAADSLQPLPDQIVAHAHETPHAVAISCGTVSITYQELAARAASLARKLVELPHAPFAPVGIFVERSIEAIIALLAAQLAGSPYLPLDPAYPPKRNLAVFDDARPFAILTTAKEAPELRRLVDIPILSTSESGSPDTPLPTLSLSHLAYLIYTSGSTGKPKGVPITHGNLAHSTRARSLFYGFDPDRFLLLSSLSFDSSVAGIFWSLSSGKTLVVLPAGEERDPFAMRDAVERNQATALLCIPSLYRELIADEPARLSSLRLAIVAGETCPSELVEFHHRSLPNCELYNEYGPTEATVWCAAAKLQPHKPVTIGQAVPGYEAHVLSPAGQLLPVGVRGELFIAGPGVSSGYRNTDPLADERFPLVRLPGRAPVRMYRSGDRVRRLIDGNLEFLGRIDDQVKLSGFRFEPAETETALRSIVGVDDALARLVADNASDTPSRLVAYLVATENFDADFPKLKKRLAESLPPHAIPSQFVLLPALPRLPNGKIDVRALPQPASELESEAAFVEPSNPVEVKLVSIWREILQLERVSTRDNFFEIGGTSLQAIRIFSKIRSEYGARISSSRLLQSPTIEDIAKLLDESSSSHSAKCLVPLKTSGSLVPIFLIHSGGLQVLFYKELAQRLDERIPLFGLQAVGHDGSEAPLTSIQDMATRYIAEIEEVHPHGPYVLLGHCFGVTVALEMAKQLAAKGKETPLLVSIDGEAPLPPGHVIPPFPKPHADKPLPIRLPFRAYRYLRRCARKAKILFLYRFGSQEQKEVILLRRTWVAIELAFHNYRSEPYSNPVLAFRCTGSEKYVNHSEHVWKRAAPNMQMHVLDCLHQEILREPTVQKTAAIIHRRLAELPFYAALRDD
ncbi:MAG TPA: amino acid adenylation domain-containing protein [Rhodothermales bacterium]|nr:amino acid adenylation domain-containing protein [Rhodothermales bacterium]